MIDPIRRAYARLGLSPDASPTAVRRRFRTLVRMWHPDRFASDPVAAQEATERMAQINRDYQLLTQRIGVVPQAAASVDAAAPRTLSRAEVDSLVSSIGTEGPLDQLFSELDYFYFFSRHPPRLSGPSGRVTLATLAAAGTLGALWTAWVTTDATGPDTFSWSMIAVGALLAFVAGLEIRELIRARRFKA